MKLKINQELLLAWRIQCNYFKNIVSKMNKRLQKIFTTNNRFPTPYIRAIHDDLIIQNILEMKNDVGPR